MLYRRSEWVRMVTAWGKLFRREMLETERFPDVKLHEDEALIYKLLYRSRQVAMVDGALYLYTAISRPDGEPLYPGAHDDAGYSR